MGPMDEEELKAIEEEQLQDPSGFLPDLNPDRLVDARANRDEDIGMANILQGISQAGAAAASQGRVKPDAAVYDAIRANAATKGKEALSDATLKQKKISDFMKQQRAAERQAVLDGRDQRNYDQRERFNEIQAGKYENEQDYRRRRDAAGDAEKAAKKAEEVEQLKTPFGTANTADDAKKIKEAGALKEKFDRSLQEMIDLRTKYGTEVANQEAVDRGKKLASELLLLQKDMSNLGVLSKTDEKILRSIIPEDPLGFSAAQMMGQDPIMSRMKKYQGDVKKDFNTLLKTRIRNGGGVGKSGLTAEQRRARIQELRAKVGG